ncbi:nucleolus protein [Pochonia chlamydosporia 170]|uniref:25S rRNA adenine-N(1) methyltransferase n=1 Tax=Pochonia chlamydosporia 170 TaxID=1380566 RepID=A0A179FA20_METCM|nr:nucleolus protein [Pochonia chlamydosporia 170]OAQ62288.1 nucleolus protein [Pochonia chlamydosporia 170]
MRPPQRSLHAGRPPTARIARRSMSRKACRNLINKHHQLEKRQRQAISQGDKETEAAISAAIADLGGLNRYQQASLQGQSNDRGGDTSKVLLEWLSVDMVKQAERRPRLLEVGSLSTRNACSSSGHFEVVHIDLNSQEPGILKQDFMERPLPERSAEKFDIISLSLVLNFVPEAESRGRMLLRTLSFLQQPTGAAQRIFSGLFPSLFVVLPRSCVDNSRYCTDSTLESLMRALGYTLERIKKTQKLAYSLWVRSRVTAPVLHFAKHEVNPGRSRNNFAITLTSSDTKSQ